jgi:hypothetical protein
MGIPRANTLAVTSDADGYQASLRTRNTDVQTRTFARFNDAILWLVFEFDAGDGYGEYGEIRHNGTLLWRKKAR